MIRRTDRSSCSIARRQAATNKPAAMSGPKHKSPAVPGENGFGKNDMNQQRKFLVLLELCRAVIRAKLLPVSVTVSTNYKFNGVA
jgi:hypothetical protein